MKEPRTRGHVATTASAQFFADPDGTMDRTREAAFLGVGSFGLGASVAPIGAVVTLVAGILEVYRPRRQAGLASA